MQMLDAVKMTSLYLLANTRLNIKVNESASLEIVTSKGLFQGDTASGAFFTLYFAGALYHLRAVTSAFGQIPLITLLLCSQWNGSMLTTVILWTRTKTP